MADKVFNVAKGKGSYFASLPLIHSALQALLLSTSGFEGDTTMARRTTITDLLGHNTENNSTNYIRKTLASVSINVDQVNDRVDVGAANPTWALLGNPTNTPISKSVIFYNPDTTANNDSNNIPIAGLDLVFTPDGSDVTMVFLSPGIFYRAS